MGLQRAAKPSADVKYVYELNPYVSMITPVWELLCRHTEARACHRNILTQYGKHKLHLQTTVWKGIQWRSDTHEEDILATCLSGDYFVNIVFPARAGPPIALEDAEIFSKHPMSSHHAPAAAEVQQQPTGCIGWYNLLFMGYEGEVTTLGLWFLTIRDFKGTKKGKSFLNSSLQDLAQVSINSSLGYHIFLGAMLRATSALV